MSFASNCPVPWYLDDPSIPSWVIVLLPKQANGSHWHPLHLGRWSTLPAETPRHTQSCCRPTWLIPLRAAFLSACSPPLCSSVCSASLPGKGLPWGLLGRLSSRVWRSESLCSVLRHLTTSEGFRQLFLEMLGPPGHLSPASLSAFLSYCPLSSRHGCCLPWLLKASLSSEMTLSELPSSGWEKLSWRPPEDGTRTLRSPLM